MKNAKPKGNALASNQTTLWLRTILCGVRPSTELSLKHGPTRNETASSKLQGRHRVDSESKRRLHIVRLR